MGGGIGPTRFLGNRSWARGYVSAVVMGLGVGISWKPAAGMWQFPDRARDHGLTGNPKRAYSGTSPRASQHAPLRAGKVARALQLSRAAVADFNSYLRRSPHKTKN